MFYKVTTKDHRSLGLRNNPTILKFPLNQWINSPTIKEGKSDDGGIWVTVNLSGARKLQSYMKKKYKKKCLIFLCSIGKILFQNSYRLKTDRIRLEKEIKFKNKKINTV